MKQTNLSIKYCHYRMLNEDYNHYKSLGITKGRPPLYDLLAYNRKKGIFLDPYIRYFEVSPNGGMTECVIYDAFSQTEYLGVAICSLSDGFCYKTGREIAYERAYANYLENVPY